MGIKTTKVWLLVAVVGCLRLGEAEAGLCPSQQFWSTESEGCVNCSRCDAAVKHVVIRPCQAHADTLCGPLSDLDIDWSWLKRKHHASDDSFAGKKHASEDSFGGKKHVSDDFFGEKKHASDDFFGEKKHASDDSFGENKHRGKKNHKHHILEDDIENAPIHHSVLDDEFEIFPAITHHGGHKHHKHDSPKSDEEDRPKKHHVGSESFFNDFDPLPDHRRSHKLPPPPPLKSTDDLEKEWKEWLIQSKNRLQHRKDDLLKNLHKESPYNEKHHGHKLNYPSINSFDDSDGEIFHHSGHHKEHAQKHFSPLDMSLFDRMLQHEVQKAHTQHLQRLGLSDLLEAETKHNDLLDIMKSEDKKLDERLRANDLSYPMDSVDFRSAVPSHRLFLGEPSTISEIMDAEDDEDGEDERLAEDQDRAVVAERLPWTATERLVWDWQAVALASAVAACLLFFTVVAIYSLLHARQWRRLKTNFDTDVEELSVKMGLMQSHSQGVGVAVSAAEAVSTNHYLDNLLEKQQQKNQKKNGNIYTQKRPQS